MSKGTGNDGVIICDPAKGFFIYSLYSEGYFDGIDSSGSAYAERVHSIAASTNIDLTSLPINMRYRKASAKSGGRVAKILV